MRVPAYPNTMSVSGTGLIKSPRAVSPEPFRVELVDTEARIDVHSGGIDVLADRRPEHLQAAVGHLLQIRLVQPSDRSRRPAHIRHRWRCRRSPSTGGEDRTPNRGSRWAGDWCRAASRALRCSLRIRLPELESQSIQTVERPVHVGGGREQPRRNVQKARRALVFLAIAEELGVAGDNAPSVVSCR